MKRTASAGFANRSCRDGAVFCFQLDELLVACDEPDWLHRMYRAPPSAIGRLPDVSWPMIRIALFGVAIVIMAGAAAMLADRLMNPAETPVETLATRFPAGWESAPVVEYKKPQPPWASAVSQMAADEFIAAVTAVERLSPPPRPPQPADAVFNDSQIASIKDRLELTQAQEPYWQAVEASLREVVWDRSHGNRPRLEPTSLGRFKEAAAPFVATLSAKQRSEIQALANIVGLQLDLSSSQ